MLSKLLCYCSSCWHIYFAAAVRVGISILLLQFMFIICCSCSCWPACCAVAGQWIMLAYILVNGMLLQSSWHIYFAVAFHVGLMLCFCWSSCQTCYAIAIHVDIYILLLQFNLAYLLHFKLAYIFCCYSSIWHIYFATAVQVGLKVALLLIMMTYGAVRYLYLQYCR